MAQEDPEINPVRIQHSSFCLEKNGGRKWPAAFPPAKMVSLDDLVEVIAPGFAVFPQTIFGGEWSVEIPVSSML